MKKIFALIVALLAACCVFAEETKLVFTSYNDVEINTQIYQYYATKKIKTDIHPICSVPGEIVLNGESTYLNLGKTTVWSPKLFILDGTEQHWAVVPMKPVLYYGGFVVAMAGSIPTGLGLAMMVMKPSGTSNGVTYLASGLASIATGIIISYVGKPKFIRINGQ